MDFDLLLDDAVAGGFIPSREFADSDAFAHAFPRILRGWEDQAFPTRHEPFARFLERVHEAVDAVAEHGRTVLIVSSGGPKAVLMRRVFDMETEAMADLLLGILNSSVSRFNVGKDGLDLAEFNTVPHLTAPDRAHAKTFI